MKTDLIFSLSHLSDELVSTNTLNTDMYNEFDVKRGLRNKDGSGVLAGLTHISSVVGFHKVEGEMVPVDGVLKYRGITITDLISQFSSTSRYCFETVCFLLLVGRLPNEEEKTALLAYMQTHRTLSEACMTHIISGIKSPNIMNKLQSAVSVMYAEDEDPESNDPMNDFFKSLRLLSKMPLIVAYSYLSYYTPDASFVTPPQDMSIAESFLYAFNEGKEVSPEAAHIMDLCLILHAEHGGGNNSTFTTRVVSSSGSDIYSTIAAAIASLKGPLHGSANKKVMDMMEDIKSNVSDWENPTELSGYLRKIIDKEAHDKSGKIYGLGHAVYTQSDPRAEIIKSHAKSISKQKNREKEMNLYFSVAEEGPRIFAEEKGSKKVISPNVDFYSGFVYDCLGLPAELYTSLFAMARTCGWCAHRIEENVSGKRIIRPGYKYISPSQS